MTLSLFSAVLGLESKAVNVTMLIRQTKMVKMLEITPATNQHISIVRMLLTQHLAQSTAVP